MNDLAFERRATAWETVLQQTQRQGQPVVYLVPRHTPRLLSEWGRGFLTGLTLAAFTLAVAMVLG